MFSGQARAQDSDWDLVLFKTISNWDVWASDSPYVATACLLRIIPSHLDRLFWSSERVLIYLCVLFLKMGLIRFGCKTELAVVSQSVQQRGENLIPVHSGCEESRGFTRLQMDCACRAHPKPQDPRGSWASIHQREKASSLEGFRYFFSKGASCTNDRKTLCIPAEYVSNIHVSDYLHN